MTQLAPQGRGGQGKRSIWLPDGKNRVAAATNGRLNSMILVLTNRHKAKYMSVKLAELAQFGRPGGNQVIALRANERVVGVCQLRKRIDLQKVLRAQQRFAESRSDTEEMATSEVEEPATEDNTATAEEEFAATEKLSQEQLKLLLDEADGVDGSNNGASANGSEPGARAGD